MAATGQDTKVHLMAAAIRAADFLERYSNENLARAERKEKLKQHW